MTPTGPIKERDLAERLQSALLPSEQPHSPAVLSATDRILDAAARRFSEVGVARTTMSSIATEAGMSREWLYRHFSNRDAVVAGVSQCELRRFIDGLAVRASDHTDVVDALTDAFVYTVEFLRDHRMLTGIIDRDIALSGPDISNHASGLLGVSVRTFAGYLVDNGGYDAPAATVIAETLSRLVASTVLAPIAELDLHDPDTLRHYAQRVVPAIAHGC